MHAHERACVYVHEWLSDCAGAVCDELTEYYDCIIIIFEVLKMYTFFVDLVKRTVLTLVGDI